MSPSLVVYTAKEPEGKTGEGRGGGGGEGIGGKRNRVGGEGVGETGGGGEGIGRERGDGVGGSRRSKWLIFLHRFGITLRF